MRVVAHGSAHEIEAKPITRGFPPVTSGTLGFSGIAQMLEISFLGETDTLFTAEFNKGYISNPSLMRHLNFDDRQDFPPAAKCESVGPESLTTEDAARLWDNIALTEQEDLAVSALNLVFGDEVKRVAMLGGGRGSEDGRRIAVRLKGRERPVSLQSLGDGAVRLFGIALALANAGAGYLVIDEAENGIHHSVQPAMWEMVFRTAHRDGVQVLATTHSWDCVRGFANAASAAEDLDGVLVRVEGANGRIRAVEYGTADLVAAAEHGIEVR